MIYILLFVVFLYFVGKYDFCIRPTKSKKHSIIISCIILILIAGLRYRVGTDTLIYTDEYFNFKTLNALSIDDLLSHTRYRPGWIVLTSFFKTIGASLYVYQICIAAIINVSIVYFLKQKVENFFSAILIYYVVMYVFFNMEIVREAIAISIFLYAYVGLEKGKRIKYFLLFFLAFSFHEAAIIMLLIPLVMNIRVSKIFIPIAIGITFLFILAPFIRQIAYQYFSTFEIVANKTEYYMGDIAHEDYTFNVSFLLNIFFNVFLPLFVIYRNRYNKERNSFYMMAVLSIFFYSLSSFMPMAYRLRYFFWLFDSVLFIDLFKYISKCNRFFYIVLVVVFLLIKSRVYFTLTNNNTPVYIKYYPYTSIFNEEYVREREELRF